MDKMDKKMGKESDKLSKDNDLSELEIFQLLEKSADYFKKQISKSARLSGILIEAMKEGLTEPPKNEFDKIMQEQVMLIGEDAMREVIDKNYLHNYMLIQMIFKIRKFFHTGYNQDLKILFTTIIGDVGGSLVIFLPKYEEEEQEYIDYLKNKYGDDFIIKSIPLFKDIIKKMDNYLDDKLDKKNKLLRFSEMKVVPYITLFLLLLSKLVESKEYINTINFLKNSKEAKENEMLEKICENIRLLFMYNKDIENNKKFKWKSFFWKKLVVKVDNYGLAPKIKELWYIYENKEETKFEKEKIKEFRISGMDNFKNQLTNYVKQNHICPNTIKKKHYRINRDEWSLNEYNIKFLCFIKALLLKKDYKNVDEIEKQYKQIQNEYMPVYRIAKYLYKCEKEMKKEKVENYLYKCISIFCGMVEENI